MIIIFCGNCGNQHEGEVRFCAKCGTPVTVLESEETPEQQFETIQPGNTAPVQQNASPVQYSPDPYAAALQQAAAPTGLADTRAQLEKKYNISRNNLLAVIALTVLNIILALLDTDLFFLFSASIPMYLLYWDSWYSTITGILTFSPIGVTAAFVTVSIYGVFWWLTQKYKGWIIAALVYFSIDVLVSLWLLVFVVDSFDFSFVIEILFMGWIMYSLISGTLAWSRLRELPPPNQQPPSSQPPSSEPPPAWQSGS